MYEIWLGMNILYELALVYVVQIVCYLLLLLACYASVYQQQLSLRRAVRPTLWAVAGLWMLAILLVPASSRSSLAEVSYVVDWLNLAGIALGMAGLAGLLLWPLFAMYCPTCRQGACRR